MQIACSIEGPQLAIPTASQVNMHLHVQDLHVPYTGLNYMVFIFYIQTTGMISATTPKAPFYKMETSMIYGMVMLSSPWYRRVVSWTILNTWHSASQLMVFQCSNHPVPLYDQCTWQLKTFHHAFASKMRILLPVVFGLGPKSQQWICCFCQW